MTHMPCPDDHSVAQLPHVPHTQGKNPSVRRVLQVTPLILVWSPWAEPSGDYP